MKNLPMSREEFREEFTQLFTSLASGFFDKVFGINRIVEKTSESETMNIKEVAEFIGVSSVTLNNWIKKDKIMSYKKGNRRYFDRAYIEKFKIVNFNFNERIPRNNLRHL